MLTRENLEKIIRKAIQIVVTLIVLLLLAYGVSKSDFNNIKKYDESDDSNKLEIPMSEEKRKMAQGRIFSTKVVINSNTMANLGDFELNIQGGKKLIMNMSLEFKNNNQNSWLNSNAITM